MKEKSTGHVQHLSDLMSRNGDSTHVGVNVETESTYSTAGGRDVARCGADHHVAGLIGGKQVAPGRDSAGLVPDNKAIIYVRGTGSKLGRTRFWGGGDQRRVNSDSSVHRGPSCRLIESLHEAATR